MDFTGKSDLKHVHSSCLGRSFRNRRFSHIVSVKKGPESWDICRSSSTFKCVFAATQQSRAPWLHKVCEPAVSDSALCLDLIKPRSELVYLSFPLSMQRGTCVHNTFCTNTKCFCLLPDPTLPLGNSPTPGQKKFAAWERFHMTQPPRKKKTCDVKLKSARLLFLFPNLFTTWSH